jgi:hypothetical protein
VVRIGVGQSDTVTDGDDFRALDHDAAVVDDRR